MHQTLITIMISLFGLVNCFFGYYAFKALLPVWGLVIGVGLGVYGVQFTISSHPVLVAIGGGIGGLAGAILFRKLYFLGVFAVGGFFTATIAGTFLPGRDGVAWLIIGVAGLIGGLASLLAQKLLIVMATSFTGAATLASGLYLFLAARPIGIYFSEPDPLNGMYLPGIAAILLLALAGTAIQLLVTGKLARKKQ